MGSNDIATQLAARLLILIGRFVLDHQIAGRVTGADGGYRIAGQRYIPDVAYISMARHPESLGVGYIPAAPELAVEVISDPDNSREQTQLRIKTADYLSENVLLWVVHPVNQAIEVYRVGQATQVIGLDGRVTGDPVLPGLTIAVRDVFAGVIPDPDQQDAD